MNRASPLLAVLLFAAPYALAQGNSVTVEDEATDVDASGGMATVPYPHVDLTGITLSDGGDALVVTFRFVDVDSPHHLASVQECGPAPGFLCEAVNDVGAVPVGARNVHLQGRNELRSHVGIYLFEDPETWTWTAELWTAGAITTLAPPAVDSDAETIRVRVPYAALGHGLHQWYGYAFLKDFTAYGLPNSYAMVGDHVPNEGFGPDFHP